jgi:hypothetical protein
MAFQGVPVYEPGYDGPPRYQGTPRPVSGPMPQVPGGMSGGRQRPVRPAAGAPSVPGAPGRGFARPAPRPMTGPVPVTGYGDATRWDVSGQDGDYGFRDGDEL